MLRCSGRGWRSNAGVRVGGRGAHGGPRYGEPHADTLAVRAARHLIQEVPDLGAREEEKIPSFPSTLSSRTIDAARRLEHTQELSVRCGRAHAIHDARKVARAAPAQRQSEDDAGQRQGVVGIRRSPADLRRRAHLRRADARGAGSVGSNEYAREAQWWSEQQLLRESSA